MLLINLTLGLAIGATSSVATARDTSFSFRNSVTEAAWQALNDEGFYVVKEYNLSEWRIFPCASPMVEDLYEDQRCYTWTPPVKVSETQTEGDANCWVIASQQNNEVQVTCKTGSSFVSATGTIKE